MGQNAGKKSISGILVTSREGKKIREKVQYDNILFYFMLHIMCINCELKKIGAAYEVFITFRKE